MTICDWHESGRRDTVVERPSWVQVESAIRAMNNRNLNDVHLDLESIAGVALTVGGGAGKYIVSGSVAAESFPTLTDPSVAEDPHVDLVVGGQLADYPACYVVGLEHALGLFDRLRRPVPSILSFIGRMYEPPNKFMHATCEDARA